MADNTLEEKVKAMDKKINATMALLVIFIISVLCKFYAIIP
ncbi:MAG TPA: hypothetical protein VGH74_19590 [Planctomycetaceae bacterium]|jgi:hypothetical protein